MTEEVFTCGRCDAEIGPPEDGDHCDNCFFPNDSQRSHDIERKIRQMRAALRPHNDGSDQVGDKWVRGVTHYEGEPIEERTYTVGNVGGSDHELLLDDGEWYGEFDLMDGEFVRQPKEKTDEVE
jgi:hypothetical protein